jgi:hypothetical protein
MELAPAAKVRQWSLAFGYRTFQNVPRETSYRSMESISRRRDATA